MTRQSLAHARSRRANAGFTLIELLVTLVIVSIGMLGLAKMQAAAIAESRVSRVRALMTFQAESLAGLIHANSLFWGQSSLAPQDVKITGTGTAPGITPTGGGLTHLGTSPALDCHANVCGQASDMASYDLTQWSTAYLTAFPGAGADVACSSSGAGIPVSCDITLTWNENYVGINRSTTGTGVTSTAAAAMTLHVEP